jgi:hypothetical protein
VALVIGGWNDADPRTVQYEGVADFPEGTQLERVKIAYYATFPEGRSRLTWSRITYVRLTPRWIQFSDFNVEPPTIAEYSFPPSLEIKFL